VWLGGRVPADRDVASAGPDGAPTDHVVILGFGIGGRLIARALQQAGRPCTILELNGAAVREAVQQGYHISYGDAAVAEPLRAAGVERAAAVVAVLSDPGATERAIRAVRALNRDVPLIARTRYRLEADRMRQAGATLAVAEELEASLEVMAQLLVRLDLPGNVTERLVDEARQSVAAISSRPNQAPAAPVEQVSRALGQMPVTSYQVLAADWAVDRTLADIGLRQATGATVLAVRRGETTAAPPPVEWRFAAGDVVYFLADGASRRQARVWLATGTANASHKGIESV
jgi:CPA2 family monovalent cation:H+ antiporter-2